MAKPNVHTASRDELVEAGVRAELADEILKRRRKGAIRLEALEGGARGRPGYPRAAAPSLLDFREQQAASGNGAGRRAVGTGGRRAHAREAPRASPGPPHGTRRRPPRPTRPRDRGSRWPGTRRQPGPRPPRSGAQRHGASPRDRGDGEVTRRSAEGTAELGQVLAELVQEQTRRNLETWTALAGAVDWEGREGGGLGPGGADPERVPAHQPGADGRAARGAPWRSHRRS